MEGAAFPHVEQIFPSQYVQQHVVNLRNMPLLTRELARRMSAVVVKALDDCGGANEGDDGINLVPFAAALVHMMFDTILGRQLCGNFEPICFTTTTFPPALSSVSVSFSSLLVPKVVARLNALPKDLEWRPQLHAVFHEDQQLAVWTLCLCWHHLQGRPGLGQVPSEILHAIFRYVCRPPFFFHKRCYGCSKLSPDLKRCGRCKQVFYCSQTCQKNTHSRHSGLCAASFAQKTQPILNEFMDQFGVNVVAGADLPYREHTLLLYGKATCYVGARHVVTQEKK